MKQLDDFIRNHRDEFDEKEPSEKVWAGIKKSTEPRISIWSSVTVWRAAAAILFVLSAYLLVNKYSSNQESSKKEAFSMQTELRDMESFYGSQIAEKVALIDHLEKGYEDDEFSQDVKKLDAMYEVLREEMKTSPSAKVKDALILNMLIRIDLLNQQIHKLEDVKKTETDKSI